MSAHVSLFPKSLSVRLNQSKSYGWDVIIEDGDRNMVFLTDEMADALSCALWNRNCPEEKAA